MLGVNTASRLLAVAEAGHDVDEGVDACNGYITASVGCWGLMQLVVSTLHSIIDVNTKIISFVNK